MTRTKQNKNKGKENKPSAVQTPVVKLNNKTPNSAPKAVKQSPSINGNKSKGTPNLKQPGKAQFQGKNKTPQSAPQAKRKKLQEEIDDELSDADFDELLKDVQRGEVERKISKSLKKGAVEESDEEFHSLDDDDDEDGLNEEMDDDDDDEEGDEDNESGEDDEDDDEDDSVDEDEITESIKAKIQPGKVTPGKQGTPQQIKQSVASAVKDAQSKQTPNQKVPFNTPVTNANQKCKETPKDSVKKDLPAAKITGDSDKKNIKGDTPKTKAGSVPSTPVSSSKSETKQQKQLLAKSATPVVSDTKKSNNLQDADDSKLMASVMKNIVEDLQKEKGNKEERDNRSLFVKNFPPTTSEEDLKALSSDIVNVRLRVSVKKKTLNKGYAFIEFKDEATAEKNLKLLKGKKVGDSEIVVDFVGEKAQTQPAKPPKRSEPEDYDPTKLFITGFSKTETSSVFLNQLFPTAKEIVMPRRKKDKQSTGYAFALFDDVAKCKKAHDEAQGKVIKNGRLVVLYAKRTPEGKNIVATSNATKRPQPSTSKKGEPTSKKAKVEQVKVQEVENNSEDDEDDDEDQDSDDDEEGDDDDDNEEMDDDEDDDEEDDDEEGDDDDDDEEEGDDDDEEGDDDDEEGDDDDEDDDEDDD